MRTLLASTAVAALALAGCQSSMTADTMDDAAPMMADGEIMVPAYIQAAVDSTARTEDMRARDMTRHPGEVLALSGVEPGDTVVEFAGFGQYYGTMLVEIVGPEGSIDVYDMPYTDAFAGEPSRAFDAAHDNLSYHQVDYNDAALPDDVDVVFNVLYFHDLEFNGIDIAALNAKIYDALKPGGTFLVIDHKAEEGSGRRDAETLHRMETSLIVDEVTAAGFELAAESDLLSYPTDDRTQLVFAEGLRGETDRALYVFRKPAM